MLFIFMELSLYGAKVCEGVQWHKNSTLTELTERRSEGRVPEHRSPGPVTAPPVVPGLVFGAKTRPASV